MLRVLYTNISCATRVCVIDRFIGQVDCELEAALLNPSRTFSSFVRGVNDDDFGRCDALVAN